MGGGAPIAGGGTIGGGGLILGGSGAMGGGTKVDVFLGYSSIRTLHPGVTRFSQNLGKIITLSVSFTMSKCVLATRAWISSESMSLKISSMALFICWDMVSLSLGVGENKMDEWKRGLTIYDIL